MQTKESRSTLVESGPITRAWLAALRDQLRQFDYDESKYYATYRGSRRAFAHLNPKKKTVRLFVKLNPSEDRDLKNTPSSQAWAGAFPSVFQIKSEADLTKAKSLIQRSHEADR
jgi:predicted transport protein